MREVTPAQTLIGRRFRLSMGLQQVVFDILACEPTRVLNRIVEPAGHEPSQFWLSVDSFIDDLNAGRLVEVSAAARCAA